MNVGELKKLLDKFDDDIEVLFKVRTSIGTVAHITNGYHDTYAFFGKEIPCLLLDSEAPPSPTPENPKQGAWRAHTHAHAKKS